LRHCFSRRGSRGDNRTWFLDNRRRFFGGALFGLDRLDELRNDHRRRRGGDLRLLDGHLALRTRCRFDDRSRWPHCFLLRGHLRLVLAHDDAARAHRRQFLAGNERLNDLWLEDLTCVSDLSAERLQLEDDVLLGLAHLLCDVAHSNFCCRH